MAGVVCIPVLVIAGLLHRGGYIDTPSFFPVLAAGFLLALLAVLSGVAALLAIWRDGGLGAGSALRGVFFGCIALTPALLAAGAILIYPQLNDVSTDVEDAPELLRPVDQGVLDDAARKAKQARDFALQREAYPDIVPRRFPIGTAELDAGVRQVLDARGWKVVRELSPLMNDGSAEIWLETRTLLIGFTDDMVIRTRPDRIGSRLDLRSASRYGVHDLGANARRIRGFLESLDAVLTEAYGTLEIPEEEEEPRDPDAIERFGPPMPLPKPDAISG